MVELHILLLRRVGVGRERALLAVAVLIVALLAVAFASSGCGSGVSEASASQAPESASSAISPEAVWPAAGVGEAPLVDLVVTEAEGFTGAERDYLRVERTAWCQICYAADRYVSRKQAGDDEGAAEAIAKVEHRAAIAAAAPAPSARFAVLRPSLRRLMDRVVRIAQTLEQYDAATTDEDKSVAARRIVRLADPLPRYVLHVGDWAVSLYCAYGGVEYPVYYAPAAPTAAAATTLTDSTTTTTTSGGGSSSGGGNQPQPNPEPEPSLSSAERRQVDALAQLDAWLMPVVQDSLAQADADSLPWDDGDIEAFCLNMSYLYDQCSIWLQKSPAGSLVASGLKEYQKGLSLVRSGALQMQSAANANSTAHQKAFDKGARQMDSALPYLNGGLAKLQRYY